MALKSCPYFTKQVHGRMCQRCLWSHSCLNGYSTNSLKKKKFFYISTFSGRKRFSTFTRWRINSQDIIFFPGLFIIYVFPSLNEGSRQKTFGLLCSVWATVHSATGAFIALLGVHWRLFCELWPCTDSSPAPSSLRCAQGTLILFLFLTGCMLSYKVSGLMIKRITPKWNVKP